MRRRWWLGAVIAATVLAAVAGSWFWNDNRSGQTKSTAADANVADANREEPAFSRSDADTFIPVTAEGYRFVGIPRTVKGPKVLFEFKNDGSVAHDLHVLRAPGGEEMGHIEPFGLGETYSLALELPPGNYIAWCQVKLIDAAHADLGMLNEFVVE